MTIFKDQINAACTSLMEQVHSPEIEAAAAENYPATTLEEGAANGLMAAFFESLLYEAMDALFLWHCLDLESGSEHDFALAQSAEEKTSALMKKFGFPV